MSWTVYFDDGSTFSDGDGYPEDVPGWGVQAIVQSEPGRDTKSVVQGDDYYYFDQSDGRWYGVELVGLIDYLTHKVGLVKNARFIPLSDFEKIIAAAVEEAVNG